MMRREIIYIWLILGALLMGVSGCVRNQVEELNLTDAELRVVAEWGDVSPADKGISMLTLYFFPRDNTSRRWRFSIPAEGESSVTLPCGRYDVVAINSDLNNMTVASEASLENLLLALSRRQTLPDGITGGSAVFTPPGELYVAVTRDLEVTPCGISYIIGDGAGEEAAGCEKECPYSLLRLYPVDVMCRYKVVVDLPSEKSEDIVAISGVLSGMAQGLHPATNLLSSSSAMLAFRMASAIEEPVWESNFLTFGRVGDAGNVLTLMITMRNGKQYFCQADVASQILNSPNPRNVIIYITDLHDFDPSDSNPPATDGFDVDVNDWEVVEIDYTFG